MKRDSVEMETMYGGSIGFLSMSSDSLEEILQLAEDRVYIKTRQQDTVMRKWLSPKL